MKFTDLDLMDLQIMANMETGSKRYNLMFGEDQQMLSGLEFGADAVATSLMNYMPVARDVVRLYELGRHSEAMQAQAKVGAAGRLIWYGPLADQGFTAEKA